MYGAKCSSNVDGTALLIIYAIAVLLLLLLLFYCSPCYVLCCEGMLFGASGLVCLCLFISIRFCALRWYLTPITTVCRIMYTGKVGGKDSGHVPHSPPQHTRRVSHCVARRVSHCVAHTLPRSVQAQQEVGRWEAGQVQVAGSRFFGSRCGECGHALQLAGPGPAPPPLHNEGL